MSGASHRVLKRSNPPLHADCVRCLSRACVPWLCVCAGAPFSSRTTQGGGLFFPRLSGAQTVSHAKAWALLRKRLGSPEEGFGLRKVAQSVAADASSEEPGKSGLCNRKCEGCRGAAVPLGVSLFPRW